jgi:hypothetical protein
MQAQLRFRREINCSAFVEGKFVLLVLSLAGSLGGYIWYHRSDFTKVSSLNPSITFPDSPRHKSSYLVEEDILAIPAFCRKLLQVPILANPVLKAKLLPELTADCQKYS